MRCLAAYYSLFVVAPLPINLALISRSPVDSFAPMVFPSSRRKTDRRTCPTLAQPRPPGRTDPSLTTTGGVASRARPLSETRQRSDGSSPAATPDQTGRSVRGPGYGRPAVRHCDLVNGQVIDDAATPARSEAVAYQSTIKRPRLRLADRSVS